MKVEVCLSIRGADPQQAQGSELACGRGVLCRFRTCWTDDTSIFSPASSVCDLATQSQNKTAATALFVKRWHCHCARGQLELASDHLPILLQTDVFG